MLAFGQTLTRSAFVDRMALMDDGSPSEVLIPSGFADI